MSRIVVSLANYNFYSVPLGTSPNFNFVSAANDTGFENTGTYKTFASFQAGADGSQIVTDVALVLDGGFGANGPQALRSIRSPCSSWRLPSR